MKRLVIQEQNIVEMVQIDEDHGLLRKELNFKRESTCSKLLMHTQLMIKKNYIIMKRNHITTIFQLLTPLLVCCLLCTWQALAENLSRVTLIDNPIETTSILPKCINGVSINKKKNGFINKRINGTTHDNNAVYKFNKAEDCISVAYGIIGERE
jgi:hypothetical protein